ncbi:MAG: MATE family efflux transporter [Proteobacteria bacterium]|jgi:putative MATE family efflux protein|nr:MATE family efflux transporter [Pseudomonadota bacterium]MDA1302564.1 MATE family efflux transporter [Pseudomonadota bacterium]
MTDSLAKPDEITIESSDARQRDLTQGSIAGHMARLSGFMMLGLVSFTVASVIETIYIGQLGTYELAAVSFTFPVVFSLQGVSMGLGIGASSVVARMIGLGDMGKVRRLMTHCLVLITVLSLAFGFCGWLVLEQVFVLLGADDVILPLVLSYMSVWLLALPVFTMAFVGTTLMRATGDAKTPGYLSTIGSVMQVVIAPFFIFGIGPFPDMGLDGAAVGFVIARYLNFFMFAYCFVVRDKMLEFNMTGFVDSCRQITHVGLPAVASNMIMPVSMSVVTRLLASHGPVVVAGYGVASRIETSMAMLVWAVSMSVAPLVGQNWGAGEIRRVRRALRMTAVFILLWGLFSYGVFFVFGELLVSLINDDPEVITAAYHYLLIAPAALGFMGVMSIATSSFNALGKPMPPLLMSILQMIVLGIPAALLGNYLFGYMGIFGGQVLVTVVLAVVAWVWLRRTVAAGIPSFRRG